MRNKALPGALWRGLPLLGLALLLTLELATPAFMSEYGLGAGITPYRDGRIASQIDMAPTLLSLLGLDAPTPLLGHDLTDRSAFSPGRALMQYDRNFALMKGDALVVLQPEKPAGYFRYQPGRALQPMAEADPALGREALLNALWGTVAYEKGWHRMVASPGRG